MSFFSKMFGGKKEASMTTGEAIQNLRETENMLIKKQEFLEKKIDQELQTARTNGTKNKRGMSTHPHLNLHPHSAQMALEINKIHMILLMLIKTNRYTCCN